jgi:electron transfer flavoprotein alpha subunit
VAEDVADALVAWCIERAPWAVLAPSTAFGREVAARVAAALGAGLVGDAIGVDVVDGTLVAAKPAFSGALVADITCTSSVQLVTVRPGVLPVAPPRRGDPIHTIRPLGRRGRVTVRHRERDDDVEVLARAEVVIGVGAGIDPSSYAELSPLAALLSAELAATRKVTDKGWAPRARQVGITGRSIAPRLYLALGVAGKFNHMVGVRAAGTVVAVNHDPTAPVFGFADVGLVADWRAVVPLLAEAVRVRGA